MDLIALSIPGFLASMGYEAWWLKKRAQEHGPSPVDYELKDTVGSLAMGAGSLVIPLVSARYLTDFAGPTGRHFRKVLGIAAASAAVTSAADIYLRVQSTDGSEGTTDGGLIGGPVDTSIPPAERVARVARVAGLTAAGALVSGGVLAASTWSAQTAAKKLFGKRILPDLGKGPVAVAAAVAGWDFIYYWNHRLQHESRIMWAIHVVHHSSERYNLSTALRQPWAEAIGMFVPYSLLAVLGVRPEVIETGRQVNLLYQYWIHTDAIRSIGPLEEVLNAPSHHRVHHGVERKYLDRNHGSILIIWDRLFGTFQREEENPTYGLTKNINTFNPLRIASHEHVAILKDVAKARTWRDRLSYVLRGPGWSPDRRRSVQAA